MKKTLLLVALIAVAIFCLWLWRSEAPKPVPAPQPAPPNQIVTPAPQPQPPQADPRIDKLTAFFSKYKAVPDAFALIPNFLNAADQHHIDYRLLPSIALAESSIGRHACGANWFGWQSCQGRTFASVADSLEFVAAQLDTGYYYHGKTNYLKLRSYNPNPAYADRVIGFMKEISNDPVN